MIKNFFFDICVCYTFILIFKFIFIYLLHVLLVVLKIKDILKKKLKDVFLIYRIDMLFAYFVSPLIRDSYQGV